jgi:hypothetical protein
VQYLRFRRSHGSDPNGGPGRVQISGLSELQPSDALTSRLASLAIFEKNAERQRNLKAIEKKSPSWSGREAM